MAEPHHRAWGHMIRVSTMWELETSHDGGLDQGTRVQEPACSRQTTSDWLSCWQRRHPAGA